MTQHLFPPDFNYLYYIIEASRMQMSPVRVGLKSAIDWLGNSYNPLHYTNVANTMRASLEIAERITRRYQKPEFGITECEMHDKTYKISQTVAHSKTFCKLQHFKKVNYAG